MMDKMALTSVDGPMRWCPYYLLIGGAGGFVGLATSAAAGMPLKWIIAYLFGALLVLLFCLWRDSRRLALGLLVFFAPFFLGKQLFSSGYPLMTGGPSSLGVFLYDLPLMFLVFYLIVQWVLGRDRSVYLPAAFVPMVIYILWNVISLTNATEPVLTLIELVWQVKMLLVLLVVVNLVRDRRDLMLMIGVLLVGLVVQELVTFSQAYLGIWYSIGGDVETSTLSGGGESGQFRAGGTLGPHNVQAAYYVLLISLAAGMYFGLQSRRVRLALVLAILGGIYAVALTYSRNGYLCLAVVLGAVGLMAGRKKLLYKRHLVMGGWLLISVAIAIVLVMGDSLFSRIRSTEAFAPRLEGIRIATNMISQHPITGVGLNNYSLAMRDDVYAPSGLSSMQQTYFGGEYFSTVVHNKYLLIAAQTGIVGLGLFLWILYIIYAHAFELFRDPRGFYGGMGMGMVAALVGANIGMLFDIYNSDLLITVFWILTGLIFVGHKISLEEKVSTLKVV